MFKPGDKVRCIVPNRGYEQPLSTQVIYTVESLDNFLKSFVLYLKGVQHMHDKKSIPVCANRFVLVESKPKRNLPDWW